MDDEEALSVLRLLDWEDGPRVSIFNCDDEEEEEEDGGEVAEEDVPSVTTRILQQVVATEEEEDDDDCGGGGGQGSADDENLDQQLDEVLASIARAKLDSEDPPPKPGIGSDGGDKTLRNTRVGGVVFEMSTAALRQWNADMQEKQNEDANGEEESNS